MEPARDWEAAARELRNRIHNMPPVPPGYNGTAGRSTFERVSAALELSRAINSKQPELMESSVRHWEEKFGDQAPRA